jgi:membrane protein DedA with SNARE-associated domain
VIEFAVNVINQIGIVGAALLIALEVVVPPIPSEAILLLTGFNVSLERFGFVEALISATIGSLIGATLLYYLGFLFTEERLEKIVGKYGKYVGLPLRDFKKTMNWFERHGSTLVLFGRMIPIIRSLVSIPAGLVRMHLGKFYFFTTIGALTWNTVWISIGLNLGENWKVGEEFAQYLELVAYAIIGAVALYLLVNMVRFFISRSKNKPE